ncbi:CAP domain-containing protein [Lacisediminimonas profundi]|uniref:CAP domain-containing protein n=1 Tax=Lacisediminimonas profundi TaxID=2603856 RepID=UPI00124B123C|nr:CAP domain-containing protein [Lacisediminimonas profundi]
MTRKPVPPFAGIILSLLAAAVLAACGGGNGESGAPVASAPSSTPLNLDFEPNAPTAVNNTATDGFNWFNYRRQQVGLGALARSVPLDRAAQAHSDYQKLNNVISHEETPGAPGYTGAELGERIAAAGYTFTSGRYAYGEVISATGSVSGFAAAEDLITAIYHRFVIFEPTFFQAGSGSATVQGGYTYFTTNFTADGLGNGLGPAGFVTYPRPSQQNTPTNFLSDREIPDPVPDRNEVGFPISIHADITSTVKVSSFTVRPQSGGILAAKLLSRDTDVETPSSAAALVPLDPLTPKTVYEVQFSGTINDTPVTRNWSFTTR